MRALASWPNDLPNMSTRSSGCNLTIWARGRGHRHSVCSSVHSRSRLWQRVGCFLWTCYLRERWYTVLLKFICGLTRGVNPLQREIGACTCGREEETEPEAKGAVISQPPVTAHPLHKGVRWNITSDGEGGPPGNLHKHPRERSLSLECQLDPESEALAWDSESSEIVKAKAWDQSGEGYLVLPRLPSSPEGGGGMPAQGRGNSSRFKLGREQP